MLRYLLHHQCPWDAALISMRLAQGCCASTLRLEWLHEEVENVNVMGRCPLYGRVGRNILLWGGFSSSWLREFAQEWMAIDDEKMVARSLAVGARVWSFHAGCASNPSHLLWPQPVDSGVPPEAREGGSCVEVLDCAEFHGLVVFGGATFSSSSRVTDVHVLLISSRPEEPAVPT